MRTMGGIALALAVLSAAPVQAQDRERARAEFEEAERQYGAGNYQLALEGYESSYRLMEGDPNQILILYNVGRCQQQLGRNADALASFERFLAEAPADSQYRPEAEDRARDLRARVAAGDVGPRGGGGGDGSALLISGIAIAALGGVALIAAIPTGVTASDQEAQLQDMCPDDACPPAAAPLLDDTRTLALVTDVLWIAGASLAAIGVALLTVGIVTDESATVGAACTEDGCVGTLRARF